MKFVALVSGGKDSYYSAMEAERNGHEMICCAHLSPPLENQRQQQEGEGEGEEESYMYQSAASEAVSIQVTECLCLPLHVRRRTGRSRSVGLVYDRCEGDEVEDLYDLLRTVMTEHPSVGAVSSGSILSTYQRARVESCCSRLGLVSLSYLWRMGPYGTQRDLLNRMLGDGLEAVLVKTASPPGLKPRSHLGMTLSYLHHGLGLFDGLHDRYDFHVCGEGGEYETLVLYCPLFCRSLVLDETKIEVEGGGNNGVGILRIVRCHAEDKSRRARIMCPRSWPLSPPSLTMTMTMTPPLPPLTLTTSRPYWPRRNSST